MYSKQHKIFKNNNKTLEIKRKQLSLVGWQLLAYLKKKSYLEKKKKKTQPFGYNSVYTHSMQVLLLYRQQICLVYNYNKFMCVDLVN